MTTRTISHLHRAGEKRKIEQRTTARNKSSLEDFSIANTSADNELFANAKSGTSKTLNSSSNPWMHTLQIS